MSKVSQREENIHSDLLKRSQGRNYVRESVCGCGRKAHAWAFLMLYINKYLFIRCGSLDFWLTDMLKVFVHLVNMRYVIFSA